MINDNGCSVLFESYHSKNQLQQIICLVENGADVNILNSPVFTILHQASQKVDVKVLEYLLANGAKVDTRSFENYTALQYAAELGHYDVVEVLSKDEANTDMNATLDDESPLYLACCHSHLKCVEILLNKLSCFSTFS